MSTIIAQEPGQSFPINGVANPIWHTNYQASTIPTDLSYRFEVLVYGEGSVATIPHIPNSDAIGVVDPSKLINSYVSFDFQPDIIYSYTRPNSTINARVKWSSYTGSALLENETITSTLYFKRFIDLNTEKRIEDNWSYQSYLLNSTSKKPMSEFGTLRRMLSTDYATITTLNGQIGYEVNPNYTSYPGYMILVSTYIGGGYGKSQPMTTIYSLQNRYPGSNLSTSTTTLEDTQRTTIDWPFGPMNILNNTGVSTNPTLSWRKIYTSRCSIGPIPEQYYGTPTYTAGTTILKSGVETYAVYWVSALPTFTGSVATFLASLESNRKSVITTINIETECKYDPIELSWMNGMGAFEYYTFRKANYKTVVMDKKITDKYPYQLTTARTMTKKTYDYGRGSYDITYSSKYNLNTDWLTSTESLELESLWTSSRVFAYIGGYWKPCVLDVTEIPIQKSPEIKLIAYNIDIIISDDKNTISL